MHSFANGSNRDLHPMTQRCASAGFRYRALLADFVIEGFHPFTTTLVELTIDRDPVVDAVVRSVGR